MFGALCWWTAGRGGSRGCFTHRQGLRKVQTEWETLCDKGESKGSKHGWVKVHQGAWALTGMRTGLLQHNGRNLSQTRCFIHRIKALHFCRLKAPTHFNFTDREEKRRPLNEALPELDLEQEFLSWTTKGVCSDQLPKLIQVRQSELQTPLTTSDTPVGDRLF